MGWLLVVAGALCGCGALLQAPTEQQGDCILVLLDNEGRVLEAPYRISIGEAARNRPVHVVYEAAGWGLTLIETTSPVGRRTSVGIMRDLFNADMHASTFDRAGTWHVRLSDRNGCVQSFDIEVTP